MHKLTLVLLLLLSTFASGAGPGSADYPVEIHVGTSRMVPEGANGARFQHLNVVINGKRYELESELAVNVLLALGDYKAKLAKDERKSPYDSVQIYEILLDNNKTRKFQVVGQSE
jgi:hypothetical protein